MFPDEDEKASKLLTVPINGWISLKQKIIEKRRFDVKIVGKNNIVQRQVPGRGQDCGREQQYSFTEEDYDESI